MPYPDADPALRERPRTASQFVADTLRAQILQGQIGAGEKLRQNHIAKSLGVSSTPVREALRDLAAEGLIDIGTHTGGVVRGLTLQDARQIYELRILLEPMLIERSFTQVSPADLDGCALLVENMLATTDTMEWAALNTRFHHQIMRPRQPTRLSRLVDSLREAAAPYVTLSLYKREDAIERSNAEHARILAAYGRRDPVRAIELAVSHLRTTLELIENMMPVVAQADKG